MKLKKIASLMLAGVMAVSMLAGCKSGSGTDATPGTDDTVVVPETGIVAALNAGQSKKNDVEIDFTDDANLNAALAAAVKEIAKTDNATTVANRVKGHNAVNVWNETVATKSANNNFYSNDNDPATYDTTKKELKTLSNVTLMKCYVVDSTDAWSPENAVKMAVSQMDEDIAKLVANDVKDSKVAGKVQLKDGVKYHAFDYTGSVSMVSEQNGDSTTTYYFAMVITQTPTEVEYEA